MTSDLSRSDPIPFRTLADLALVLRIIDEIPRTPLRRATSWCLFKKTADVSVDRQSRRTIARTPPPAFLFPDQRFQRPRPERFRPHCLAPVVGGGGDLVASDFRVKRLIRRRTSFLSATPKDLRGGGSGVSREGHSLCQPNLSVFFSASFPRELQAAKGVRRGRISFPGANRRFSRRRGT